MPPELFIPDAYSVARFTLWPVFWLLVVWLIFYLSDIITKKLNHKLKAELGKDKLGKVSAYLVEIIVTSFALGFLLYKVNWYAIFEENYWTEAPDLLGGLFETFEGLVMSGYAVVTLYIVELAWNHEHMQASLKLHHVCSVLFAFIGFTTVSNLDGDVIPYLRILCFFILYAITEQAVFILMLLYRFEKKPRTVRIQHALALLYILTRIMILSLEIWSTYAAFRDFSKRPPPEETFVYTCIFFGTFLPTLLAISYAQLISGRVIWGITRKQAKRARKAAKLVASASMRFFEGSSETLGESLERLRGSFSSFGSFRNLLALESEEDSEVEKKANIESQASQKEHISVPRKEKQATSGKTYI